MGVGINSRLFSFTSNTGKFLKTDLTASVTITGSWVEYHRQLNGRLLNSQDASIVSLSLLLTTFLGILEIFFIRKFFSDTSPSPNMFPYFCLEAFVGSTLSSSLISTLYTDKAALLFW